MVARVVSLWPIVVLGLVRFVVLWAIDYHVPVSEYGVHWNFFCTIASVALVATLADLGPRASALAAVALLVAYQLFLSCFGGAHYILHAPRAGFFSQNREGFLSAVGFLGLHWLAVSLGACLQSRLQPSSVACALLATSVGSFTATEMLAAAGVLVSRRMCNLPYALFVIGINALVLGLLALLDLRWPVPRVPMPSAYAGVQASMFATFLVANLCTGVINLAMQPLLVPAWAALAIMVLYSASWTLLFAVLHSKGLAFKFY